MIENRNENCVSVVSLIKFCSEKLSCGKSRDLPDEYGKNRFKVCFKCVSLIFN